ncbi:MAG: bifunctional diguanylate cyclase/phosphodiesterase [Gammaproteobacteria bacterium]|nr:bifunctional diguanylate cyclase/phosphodiesterase [Gammaproteobacteria bacterium]
MLKAINEDIDFQKEKYVLNRALLNASMMIPQSSNPQTILKTICDSLIKADHLISNAYIYFGETDLCPDTESLITTETIQSAFANWMPVTCNLQLDTTSFNKSDHKCLVALPIGKQDSQNSGLIILYSNISNFFDHIGTDFFSSFTHLVNNALDQSALLNNLSHLASHDMLTGAMNRRGIQEILDKEIARSKRKQTSLSIILFDIDRFKLVNDRLGHTEGDKVLEFVSNSAFHILRSEDYFGRWGGEEFICVIPDTPHCEAIQIAERIRKNISSKPIQSAQQTLDISASFGVASFPQDADCADKLVIAADTALYQAKRSGRDRVVSINTVQQHIYNVGSMLESALCDGRIVPAFQPIVDLNTGDIVAEEVLAQLKMPTGEMVAAKDFIDSAHQLQLLHRIDRAILLQAFSRCTTGINTGANRIDHFVNISADLLCHRDLVEEIIESAFSSCHQCGDKIGAIKPMVIEITERELLADIDTAIELLTPFTDFGLRLALDDFGSGYSSFHYLADLPIEFLKIDGVLIQRIQEPKVRAIVQGIQDTASSLGITTLAEYVEDPVTEAILKDIGINWGQGFYYGKPDRNHPLYT